MSAVPNCGLALPGWSGIAGGGGGGGAGGLWWQQDWPEGVAQGGNTIYWYGTVPIDVTLISFRARMTTINTQGNYTVALTNVGTGNTMLVAATFNMNTLVAATWTALVLTATAADLVLAADDEWTLTLVSDNALFDGSGIYFQAYFQ